VAAPATVAVAASRETLPQRPRARRVTVAEPGLAGTPTRRYVAAVEQRLQLLFAEQAAHWSVVDPWLADALAALAGAVLGGGKRLRPLFCAYGFMAAGGTSQPPDLVDVAAALELLHAFALIHDDVMDGSSIRRSRPSLHQQLINQHEARGHRGEARRSGEGTAVLIGDLGFALAQRLVSAAPPPVVATWHELCTELVMGQYLDLAGTARGGLTSTRALTVSRYKSGCYSVERPMQLGALLAGRPASIAAGLFPFAPPLGEAFQLRDDVLGAFGDVLDSGKPSGEDLRQGKPTLLLALGLEMARGTAADSLMRAGQPGLSDSDVEMMRRALEDCGARQEVESRIWAQFQAAMGALDGCSFPGTVKDALRDFAVRAVWRRA
jgi:geranylgeranyl diphosphate synthase, type I